jgi:DUF971 family protein
VSDQGGVRIAWSDGHLSDYSYAYLRGWCPCAMCQGHGGERRFIRAVDPQLRRIEPVGNYALTFTWSDGHETGIYSYAYLREICPCEACQPTVA